MPLTVFLGSNSSEGIELENLDNIRQIYSEDDEITAVLAEYLMVEQHYRQTLAAMYSQPEPVAPVRNSADVAISVGQDASIVIE